MLTMLLLLLCTAGVLSVAHGQSTGACMCLTGTSVNVRNPECGSVVGSANSGQCFTYKGTSRGCSLSGTWYNYMLLDFNGQDGWITDNYLTENPLGCGGGGDGDYTCEGDMARLSPNGASQATANQDGLGYSGVPASNTMVDTDESELNVRKSCYMDLGEKYCIEPSLIAALASRESRGGRLLYSTNGWGDNGNAYGILQCDVNTSGLGSRCTSHDWRSCAHMDMMIDEVFLPILRCVQNRHTSWLRERQLQGGVAGYNFGCSNVWTWENLDQGTTNNDYSNDVMARAQRLKSKGTWG